MFLAKHTVRVPGLVTRHPNASRDPEGTPASRSGAEDTGPAKWAGDTCPQLYDASKDEGRWWVIGDSPSSRCRVGGVRES